MVLERIQKENDIQNIAKDELPVLAQEIREFLVEKISRTGGHLASNLGVVELTIAMHLCFHLPEGCGTPVLHAQDSDRTPGRF